MSKIEARATVLFQNPEEFFQLSPEDQRLATSALVHRYALVKTLFPNTPNIPPTAGDLPEEAWQISIPFQDNNTTYSLMIFLNTLSFKVVDNKGNNVRRDTIKRAGLQAMFQNISVGNAIVEYDNTNQGHAVVLPEIDHTFTSENLALDDPMEKIVGLVFAQRRTTTTTISGRTVPTKEIFGYILPIPGVVT